MSWEEVEVEVAGGGGPLRCRWVQAARPPANPSLQLLCPGRSLSSPASWTKMLFFFNTQKAEIREFKA